MYRVSVSIYTYLNGSETQIINNRLTHLIGSAFYSKNNEK